MEDLGINWSKLNSNSYYEEFQYIETYSGKKYISK